MKAQYRDRMSGGLLSIEVPELELTIYHKPSLSLKQQAPISKLLSEGKHEEALVQTLIIRALDADGKPLFRGADKVELMNMCDPDIIARVCVEMSSGDNITTEEVGND